MKQFLFNQVDLNGDTGYASEVDIEYPRELHNYHNDFPLLPKKLNYPNKTVKLTPNSNNKYHYVLNFKILHQPLLCGLKSVKVHKVILFSQSAWMKSYIDMNTELRSKCKDKFGKKFYKLISNSVFGQTMESVRNRINIKLCRTPEYI